MLRLIFLLVSLALAVSAISVPEITDDEGLIALVSCFVAILFSHGARSLLALQYVRTF